jgi:hypothetical protein
MREAGLSLRAIAARLGISLSTASLWTRGVVRPAVPGAAELPPPAGPLRRCSRCRRTLPETEFSRRGAGRQWWCRACFRDYYAERRSHHRARGNALKARRVAEAQAYVLGVLASPRCAACGVADPLVLEFDHLGDKRADIATLVGRGVRGLRRVGRLRARLRPRRPQDVDHHAARAHEASLARLRAEIAQVRRPLRELPSAAHRCGGRPLPGGSTPSENRTRATTVKGWRADRYTMGAGAPRSVGQTLRVRPPSTSRVVPVM